MLYSINAVRQGFAWCTKAWVWVALLQTSAPLTGHKRLKANSRRVFSVMLLASDHSETDKTHKQNGMGNDKLSRVLVLRFNDVNDQQEQPDHGANGIHHIMFSLLFRFENVVNVFSDTNEYRIICFVGVSLTITVNMFKFTISTDSDLRFNFHNDFTQDRSMAANMKYVLVVMAFSDVPIVTFLSQVFINFFNHIHFYTSIRG